MPLPAPIETSLPSLTDATELSCRVYLPASGGQGSPLAKAAVVAHPYAPLGGDFNDPVVLLAAEELHDAGFVVTTFNFRGASNSRKAATSWTGKPEVADYSTVLYFLVHFVLALNTDAIGKMRIVLGGYSYGSMIASLVRPASEIVTAGNTELAYTPLKAKASSLATSVINARHMDPKTSDFELPVLESHYLLISPLLPPITSFLTMFSEANRDQHLQMNRTLAIFGSHDHFTASSKLRRWADKIGIQGEEIEGADHFWHDINAVQKLRQTIQSWAA